MDFNQFAIDNDLYAEFVSQYDFSALQRFPEVYSRFSLWGIGEQITDNGEYDHESGQLTAEWASTQQIPEKAMDLLIQIADDYAEFVKRKALANV